MVEARCGAVVLALLLAACGGASSGPSLLPQPTPPMIEFTQNGSSWNATPVEDELDEVSNNGLGYTGEIAIFELRVPATGRLQVALTWDHESDFDLIIAADREATIRLAEGVNNDATPEYVGLEVVAGQLLYLLVAGWTGDPGKYTLETILLPPGTPVFELTGTSDLSQPVPRNAPIRFFFSQPLDPLQPVEAGIAFLTTGHLAEGSWCIEGNELSFHPRPPEAPGDRGGLHEDTLYLVQFNAAGHGLRAASGEYLAQVEAVDVPVGGLVDDDPDNPPAVLQFDHDRTKPWLGTPLTVTVRGMLDPNTVEAHLYTRDATTGAITGELAIRLVLSQARLTCIGGQNARLSIEPIDPLPPAASLRLVVPDTVLGITGDPSPANRMVPFIVGLFTD